jgi:DNA polymerase elongation subunit (family B)
MNLAYEIFFIRNTFSKVNGNMNLAYEVFYKKYVFHVLRKKKMYGSLHS